MVDASHHLELEENRIEASRPNTDVYMMASNSKCTPKFKRKFPYEGKKGNNVPKKGKCASSEKFESHHDKGKGLAHNLSKKKNMANVKCYNCGKEGHFAHDYNEPKKVHALNVFLNDIYVLSSVLLTESNPSWTIDLGATDHVARDRSSFVEYRQIPCGTK